MITKTLSFNGAFLVVVGLLGFVAPGFMGVRLGVIHNLVILLSGAVAIYFGLKAMARPVRTLCLVFGALYGILGLVGFVAGGLNHSLTIIPGGLVLGTMDHLVHVFLGVVFLSVGWAWRVATATPAPS
jgi:hypothetical protein